MKWSEERRAKFKRTMAAKNAVKVTTIEEIGPQRKPPSEVEEFARFMAAAWKLYKRGL